MKSGTNRYHGDLFEINRNSFFDSVGFFNGPAWGGSNKPPPITRTTTGSASAVRSAFLTSMTAATGPSATTARSGTSRTTRTPTSAPFRPRWKRPATSATMWTAATGTLIPIYDPYGSLQRLTPAAVPRKRHSDRAASAPLSQSLIQYIPDPDRPGSGVGGLTQQQELCAVHQPEHSACLGLHGRSDAHAEAEPPLQPVAQQLQHPQLRLPSDGACAQSAQQPEV